MITRRAFAALWAPLAASAQSNQEKAQRIVAAAIEALGGERFKGMKDREEVGRVYSFYNSRLSGFARATILTRYLVHPERPEIGKLYVRERQTFGKKQDYSVMFDEDNGYSITFRGAAPLPDAQVTRYRDSARRNAFYLLRQRLGEPGLIMEARGTEIFDNQPTDVVDFTDSDNMTVSVQFHQTTHLPVRQVFFRRNPVSKEKDEEEALYSKYREVKGVQWPYAITRHKNGEKVYEIFSESVRIDEDFPDQLFTIPANMKILPQLK